MNELQDRLAIKEMPVAMPEPSAAQKATEQFDQIIAKRLGSFKSESKMI